jgi:ATP-dependent DNA helicase RecQ
MAIPPTPLEVLRETFGYPEFRPGQEKIITAVLAGRDCLGVMPTGAGKSLTFQIPARILPGTVLVLSPLISLMKDQVDALQANGFRSTVVNSTLDPAERGRRLGAFRRGEYELVYLAPEALEGGLRDFLSSCPVSMVVVDEAHCISHWGHDFRPAYRKLQGLKAQLGDIPILALTATATRRVAGDIIQQLGMRRPEGYKGSFFRSNLLLTFQKKGDGRNLRRDLLTFIRQRRGASGIVYCLSRKSVESVADFLVSEGVAAKPYHAGLTDREREHNQNAFIRDQCDVMVATIAFGMGINKSNIRYVIHRDMPRTIENYYQEIGRAGRDGLPSDCVLFYSWADVMSYARFGSDAADPEAAQAAQAKTVEMFRLAERSTCRHRELVAHFDEAMEDCGGSCDHCRGLTLDDLLHQGRALEAPQPSLRREKRPAYLEVDRDDPLFTRLRELRRALADELDVPAYIVFSDAVLMQIARRRPRTSGELLAISGVGQVKLARFGEAFLKVVKEAGEGTE